MANSSESFTGRGQFADYDPSRFKTEPNTSNHFAWLRTRMSIERTLMAVVRTSVSLIGFGFTIVQFFDRLHDMEGAGLATRPEAPRFLGLALIGGGVISALIAAWQYRGALRYLWNPEFASVAGVMKEPARTAVFYIAILVAAIGIFAFGSVFLRLR
jgi:putative membrane protein